MKPDLRGRVLLLALGLGVLSDLLLRVGPRGINVTICTVALLGAGAWLVRARRLPVSAETAWLTLTALLLAFAFVRRDSQLLRGLDLLSMIATLGLAAAAFRGVRLARLNVRDQIWQVGLAAIYSIGGGVPLAAEALRSFHPAQGLSRARAVARGAAIALPLLFGFGILFASADPVFGSALNGALSFDPGVALSHVALTVIFGALSAGYLSWAVLQPKPEAPRALPFGGPALGAWTVNTALGLVAGLFFLFVVFQAGELFGGSAFVADADGPSYSEYARQGFFQLLAVAALVLPLLLAADRAIGRHDGAGGRWFRGLARTLLVLLFVVITSALERMRLYVTAYGLSEERFYATAAMGYVAFLAAWLGVRVVRARRRRFAPGALVAGYVALTALHLVNPDATIVRVNLSRPATTRAFDASYAASLSADAVPALLDRLPTVDEMTRCGIAKALLERWSRPRGPREDWRAFNWSRFAEQRIAEHLDLHALSTHCVLQEAK